MQDPMVTGGSVGGGNPGGFNIPDIFRTGASGGPSPILPAPFPAGQNMPPIHSTLNSRPHMMLMDPISSGGGGDPLNYNSNTGYSGGGGGGGVFDPTKPTKPVGGGGKQGGNTPAPTTGGGGPGSFPANGPGGTSPLTNFNPASALGFGGVSESSFLSAMQNAGFGSGVASLLWNFLQSGAGFNPQIAQSLIAALQPQINRGMANIQEQFGAEGLGASSPAAIGQADFLSQVNLNEGQIFAQMEEQAVQNYMNVLMGGKATPLPSGLGALIGGAGSLAGGLASLWKVLFPSSNSSSGGGGGGGGSVNIPLPTGGGGDGSADPSMGGIPF